AAPLWAQQAAPQDAPTADMADDAAAGNAQDGGRDLVVIGSRGRARSDVDRPVPVDVVTADDLAATGQTDLGQQIQFSSPSFNSAKYGVNGATNFADPASLRGMAPDQVLLLVNGHRRHQFSALNLNVSPGLGTVVSDLNSIPTAAVGRIEVLRDGAAAQYGSDAIAGIVNLSLNDSADGGTLSVTTGLNSRGDGFTMKASLNQGLALGSDGGFINYTLEHFSTEGTNRSDPYNGALYPATPATYATTGPTADFPYSTATPRADRGVYPQGNFVVGNYGANRNRTYQGFINSELPVSDNVTLYGFGGYSRKDIRAFGFFRAPATRANAVLSIFPDGYVPVLPGRSIDYSVNAGVMAELAGWKLDLGYGFGHNHLDQYARNTVNASLGAASPTSFYVGRTEFNQQVIDFSASRDMGAWGGIDAVNLAFGVAWRRDNFQVHRGDAASYAVGPLTASGRTAGSNGRPGYAPADENDLSRRNIGAFIDLEADVSDAFLVTTALRYENYSDFGGNLSGKLAARYKISDGLAVRGSYNRGFRAPSLAQIGNRVNTSTVQNNQILQTQQIASSDPRLALLGIPDPKAEISDNFSAGVTGDFGRFTFTVDAFQINIQDRIAITDGLLSANFPAVAALFPGVREIRFFTNQIDTRTRGVDVVGTYKMDLGPNSLSLTIAGTHAVTDVRSQRATPAALVAGASAANQAAPLLGLTAVELIEVAQPRTKILFSGNFETGALTIGARATYFGSVQAFSTGLNAADSNVACNSANRCVQEFSPKTIVDLNATYRFSDAFTLTVGANNLFNTYPDKWNNLRDGAVGEASSYSNGQTPYTRNANQFGFNGSYYYMTASVRF
ncbi:MAG: TonB-dependent receptor plug domain-containing protein, partial [Sphingopyxis sp.]